MNRHSIAKSVQSFFKRRQSAIERERLSKIGRLKNIMESFAGEYPDVEAVYIIGSLNNPVFYRSGSDIDIVVKGLSVENALKAAIFLEKKVESSLDLILWEDVKDRAKVLKEGMKIYEKNR